MTKAFNRDARFSIVLDDTWKELDEYDSSVYPFIKKISPIGVLQISLVKRLNESPPTKLECENILKNHFQRQELKPKKINMEN